MAALKNILGFSKGNARSNLAKKNILASLVIRGLNIGITLLLVPLIINFLDPTRYGIWITLSSIIGWFGFFDIGLGNGLRNRLTEALALGEKELAKAYVSTTYAILTIIIFFVLILFYIVNPFLNWNKLLNAGDEIIPKAELSLLASIVFTFFCIQFVLKLLTTILIADQRPAKASIFDLISKAISFCVIFLLLRFTDGSLLYLGVVISGIPFFVLLTASVCFYNGRYKEYKPSLKSIDFSLAQDLFKLGIKFFIIQIAAILLYQTNIIIITQLFGPDKVTSYSVSFQYFSVLLMLFSIIISPFWSAFTEAWAKHDIKWIENIMRKLLKIWFMMLLLGIIMFLLSKKIYYLWVGEDISISYSMSALLGIWILMNIWNSIYSQFLNGVGKLKLQLLIGISSAVFNIPLSIILGMRFGIIGVLSANIIVGLLGAAVYPYQYKRIINGNAKGIWNE